MPDETKKSTRHRLAALGLSAGLLSGGAAGFLLTGSPSLAGAQDSASVSAQDATTTTVATTNSAPSGETPEANHSAGLTAALAPLVADGTLNQSQADAAVKAIIAAHPMGGRGGHGPDGPGGRGPGGPEGLEAAATVLGTTATELRTALGTDKSLADIAGEKGVEVSAVVDALYNAWLEHEATEVAAGQHTQAEVDARAADMKTRITEQVSTVRPVGGPGGRGGHGPGMGAPGQATGDQATADQAAATTTTEG